MKAYDQLKAWVNEYAKTGWKVALLQVFIGLVWLGIYALSGALFGDFATPKVDSFIDYLIFPVALVIMFGAYLLVNGMVARKVFKWK